MQSSVVVHSWRMGQTSDKRMIRFWYQSVQWSVVLICAYGLCSTSNGLEDEDCAMGLSSMKQTIRLVDSGDGFTEMVPPEPQLIHIWPNERAILFYQANRPTTQNKVWLYTPPGQEFGYRLKESVSCIEQGTRYIPDPHEETFWINTSESGSYMFAEYDTNWKLAKTTGKHYGRNELYNPLVTFMVLSLEPANIGLTLKMTQFEPFENCTGANEKTEWVFRTLFNMRMFRSVRTDKAMLDGNLTHKVIETKCHLLSDDESPVEIFAYYNIDRTRITSNGVQAHKERKWAVKDKQLDDIQFRDRKEITLPQPFGAGVRIRLVDIILPPISGLRITLITRSEEGMSEGFWGPGNVEPPFPDEQIMPYPFAVVDLNRTIFHQLLANNKSILDWMLIEPYYGRLRTSTGLMVPFNVKDRWVNGQFLTALKFEAIGNEADPINIRHIIYERPQHPTDVGEILRVLHTERPLPGATPLHGRACLSTVHGYYTSTYHVNLEKPSQCIELDKTDHRVYKKTGSPRSPLTSYSIQLLYDDFGDELENATGVVTGHVQMISFPRKHQTHLTEFFCPMRTIGEDGEVMRIGFVVGRNEDVQYISRWENRWVRYHSTTGKVFHMELEGQDRIAESLPGFCGPERSSIDFVYNLETKYLQVVANDTRHTLVNVTLSRHPMWLGLEMFTDPKVPRCEGCYVNVFIDRRGVHLPYATRWPTVDSSINDWNQIQYPKQYNSKALNIEVVNVVQKFEIRSALFPSPKNLQRRLIELTRKLANSVNISVTVLEANAHCPPGQYMPYGTPAVCVKCPPGTRSQKLTQNTSFPVYVCDLCPRGMYQDQPGQEDCKRCDPRQSTPRKGSWSRGSCGPNVTTDGIFVAQSGGMPAKGEPYVMVELPSSSKEQIYDWTTHAEEKEFQTIEGPGELNMVSTGRLVFNMISLVLLLGCVMAFVVTSKGYMLIWITQRTRYRFHALEGSRRDQTRSSASKKLLWPSQETSADTQQRTLESNRSFSVQ
ncbi:hypothetical protein D915_008823 [Fasciola hepatica]|uniref:Tyrosine-protein kinase ephrin type A/B receptor-like domain-containing protein n=1 Tax=Fasciola hepatica TaxID=6192 RepID=A0A4E0R555_FASHE|nr:hypothetical protein D915_008823 [Fasciola hepatica]